MGWTSLAVALATAAQAQLPTDDPLVEPSGVKDPTGSVYPQHSLVKPFFSPDGISIPNWNWLGNTVVTDDYIRLTPDRQAKRGAVWNAIPFHGSAWEATIHFSVNGQGKSLFGDGFAFWYTKNAGQLGTALGNSEVVDGLGILFDTYDNHQEDHGHPWVSALVGNGAGVYNHDEDGKQVTRGGCQSFFRNMDHPTYARITYWHDIKYLEVKMRVNEEAQWTNCFTETNVELPPNYYFGLSASTGDLADNHDIYSVRIGTAPVPTEEQRALSQKATEDAAKQIGSMAAAELHKKMKHMDPNLVQTNHHENFGGRAAEEPLSGPEVQSSESSIGLYILYGVLIVAVIGAVAYFAFLAPDKKKFDY